MILFFIPPFTSLLCQHALFIWNALLNKIAVLMETQQASHYPLILHKLQASICISLPLYILKRYGYTYTETTAKTSSNCLLFEKETKVLLLTFKKNIIVKYWKIQILLFHPVQFLCTTNSFLLNSYANFVHWN